MLANVFYFCGLFLFLFNLLVLSNVIKINNVKEFTKKFLKVTNKNPEKENFSGTDYELLSFYITTNFFTAVWFFCGLIGANWVIFLSFFVYNSILRLLSSLINLKSFSVFLDIILFLANSSLIGLLVFNHFHLHYNLTKFLFP